MPKETYVCISNIFKFVHSKWHIYIYQIYGGVYTKRVLSVYISKETHTYNKSKVNMPKETYVYIYDKRDPYICPKRQIRIYDKRDQYI